MAKGGLHEFTDRELVDLRETYLRDLDRALTTYDDEWMLAITAKLNAIRDEVVRRIGVERNT